MRRRLDLPDRVKTAIREHLSRAMEHAVSGYEFAHEAEDTLTGELGSAFRSGIQKVIATNPQEKNPGEWKWEIRYYKFRGNGPNSTENAIGADGLFELKLDLGSVVEQKSLLFQAKVTGAGRRGLLKQCLKLTTWREAAFVLVYSESAITAIPLEEAIRQRGAVSPGVGKSLDLYLGNDFLDCEVGDNDLFYDGRKKQLIWQSMSDQVVATKFQVSHRISLNVKAPVWGKKKPNIQQFIEPQNIHEYRMRASDNDLLGLRANLASQADVQRQRQRLALVYHPDNFQNLDEPLRQIANREMQEINNAADRFR